MAFGDTPGYLTLLKLRTFSAFTFEDPVIVLAEDSASKNAYGQRIKSIDARWTREAAAAQAAVRSRLARRIDPKTALNVVIPGGSKANLMLILHRSFSDRVTVEYGSMGVRGDFFIEGHRIVVDEGWSMVARELLLQAV